MKHSIKSARAKKIEHFIKEKKVKLTTRQILLYLVDGIVLGHQIFDKYHIYKKTFKDYQNWREYDKKRFSDNLKRLEKEGLIKIVCESKESSIELTNKGREKVKMLSTQDYKYKYPENWDEKWRLIIFDIPNTKRKTRDILRDKLKHLGCFQLQESVFVFPFDCKDVIDYIKTIYKIEPYVQYVIAEAIETEVDLIGKFIDRGLLNKDILNHS